MIKVDSNIVLEIDGRQEVFFNEQIDHKRFLKFLNTTPPTTEDIITNVHIERNVPTWIFYPSENDPTLRNGKIEQDDVTILTFHEGKYEYEEYLWVDVMDQPLAQGTYNGKVGYWELEMRGNLLPEFAFDLNCQH